MEGKSENNDGKDDEEMNEDEDKKEERTIGEEPDNPDLDWETTAKAEEAKRQAAVLENEIPYDNPLLVHLYTNCKLVERVVDAWEENEIEEPRRKGYMGHLTRIANIMVSLSKKLGSVIG